MGVIFSSLQRFEGVASMEILRNIFSIVSLNQEATTRMRFSKFGHIKHKVIENYKFLFALQNFQLKIFVTKLI